MTPQQKQTNITPKPNWREEKETMPPREIDSYRWRLGTPRNSSSGLACANARMVYPQAPMPHGQRI